MVGSFSSVFVRAPRGGCVGGCWSPPDAPGGSRIRSTTRAVHPVWCIAPRPAPSSPWKYSKKSRLSFQAGSSWSRCDGAEDRAVAVLVGKPDRDQAVGQVLRDLPERVLLAGAGGVLESEVVAEEAVAGDELANRQVVQRASRPGRASSSCHRTSRCSTRPAGSRCVAPGIPGMRVRVTLVALGHRAQPVRREERLLVEELPQGGPDAGRGAAPRRACSRDPSTLADPPDAGCRLRGPSAPGSRANPLPSRARPSAVGRGRSLAGSSGIRPAIVRTLTEVDSPEANTSRS